MRSDQGLGFLEELNRLQALHGLDAGKRQAERGPSIRTQRLALLCGRDGGFPLFTSQQRQRQSRVCSVVFRVKFDT